MKKLLLVVALLSLSVGSVMNAVDRIVKNFNKINEAVKKMEQEKDQDKKIKIITGELLEHIRMAIGDLADEVLQTKGTSLGAEMEKQLESEGWVKSQFGGYVKSK